MGFGIFHFLQLNGSEKWCLASLRTRIHFGIGRLRCAKNELVCKHYLHGQIITNKMTGSVHFTDASVWAVWVCEHVWSRSYRIRAWLTAFLLGLNGSVFEFYHTTLLHGSSWTYPAWERDQGWGEVVFQCSCRGNKRSASPERAKKKRKVVLVKAQATLTFKQWLQNPCWLISW